MFEGTTAIKTLHADSNLLADSVFSTPVRLGIGVTKNILTNKASRNVLGRTFAQAAAVAYADIFEKREIQQTGILYQEQVSRPTEGAFVLLSEDDVDQMLTVLKDLGLPNFEDSTPVDFFVKPVLDLNQDHVAPTPIESELVFKIAKTTQDKVQLLFRVVVMDPAFVDNAGKNLKLTELPQKYIEGVLNSLNPAAYLYAYTPQQIDTMLGHAGKNTPIFKSYLIETVKKWRGLTAPKDLTTLKLYLKQGLLHEFTHALVLNMPDLIPSTLPQAEQDRLNQFSVKTYMDLLNTKVPELHTSIVYTKNLIKALQMVESLEPSVTTQNQVVRLLALEMFCDRFSMYMYETARKMQVYHDIMPGLGDISVDTLRRMEKQRLSNPEAFRVLNEITVDELNDLDKKSKAAEREHVYISAFGDPAILASERDIFEPFLDLLRHFDREKTITLFTEEHSKGGFFKATRNNTFITENKIGVNNIVKNTEQLGEAGNRVCRKAYFL